MSNNFSKREANKAEKRTAFMKAAERLFIEKGYENTSIEDIVKAAGITKRTLYQYFQNKEDLYYAIALEGAKQLYAASTAALEQGKSTREKIYLMNLAHLEFYKHNFDAFRILNYTPANKSNDETSPHFQEIRRMDAERMMILEQIVTGGVADGSINPNFEMRKAVLFGVFSAFSMLYTFAFTDKSMWQALQINEEDFLRFSFELFSKALE